MSNFWIRRPHLRINWRQLHLLVAFLCFASEANALCTYNGVLYAKTTQEQEFHDSRFVVRATVIKIEEKPQRDNSPTEPGVLYVLKLDETFKGKLPATFTYYSERDSGGFYLDQGKQYLLFLNPMTLDDLASHIAPHALRINYNCGQSALWAQVSPNDRKHLHALSKGN